MLRRQVKISVALVLVCLCLAYLGNQYFQNDETSAGASSSEPINKSAQSDVQPVESELDDAEIHENDSKDIKKIAINLKSVAKKIFTSNQESINDKVALNDPNISPKQQNTNSNDDALGEEVGDLVVVIKKIEISGVRSVNPNDLDHLTNAYLNRKLNFNQLLEITSSIEQYYRQYDLISRVIMPPQNLAEGTLKLEVIESKLSAVKVEQELNNTLPKTKSHILDLIENQQAKGAPLNTAAIERGLGLVNDLPGVSATGGLQEGQNEAETELILKLYANKSRQQELMVDNYGSNATGVLRLTGIQTWLNPRDWGDKFSTLAVVTEGSKYVKIAYDWAVGNQGWRIGTNLSNMTYKVVNGVMGVVGASGEADDVGISGAYPLVRSPQHDSTVNISYDQRYYNNVSAQNVSVSSYQVRAGTVDVNGVVRNLTPGSNLYTYDASVTTGYVDLNGSMNQIMDASGPNTAGAYTKFRFIGTVTHPLTVSTSLFGSLKFQRADKNTDGSEGFGLGGIDGVRAYPNGEGGGSQGELLTFEVRHNLNEADQISAFYDVGSIDQKQNPNYPGGPNPNTYVLQGVGLGYTRSFNNGTYVKLLWARRLGENPNPTQTGADQDGTTIKNRIWLQAVIPF